MYKKLSVETPKKDQEIVLIHQNGEAFEVVYCGECDKVPSATIVRRIYLDLANKEDPVRLGDEVNISSDKIDRYYWIDRKEYISRAIRRFNGAASYKQEEAWIEYLQPIIDDFKDGDDSPLDGDDVDRLVNIIRNKINLNEGNLTRQEYFDDRIFYGDVKVQPVRFRYIDPGNHLDRELCVLKNRMWHYLLATDEEKGLWNKIQAIISALLGRAIEKLLEESSVTMADICEIMDMDKEYLKKRMAGDMLFGKKDVLRIKDLLDKNKVEHNNMLFQLAASLLTYP